MHNTHENFRKISSQIQQKQETGYGSDLRNRSFGSFHPIESATVIKTINSFTYEHAIVLDPSFSYSNDFLCFAIKLLCVFLVSYHGTIRKLLRDTQLRDIEAWELVLVFTWCLPLVFPYFSFFVLLIYLRGSLIIACEHKHAKQVQRPVEIWISTLYSSQGSGGSVHCTLNE